MKLKTEKEIEKLAIECDRHNRIVEINNTKFDISPIPDKIFITAYTQAQQDMLESASEGFMDYLASHDQGILWSEDDNGDEINLAERVWQACSISHAKKMQEKDVEIERLKKKLENEDKVITAWKESYVARTDEVMHLRGTTFKLRKENQEMCEALDTLTNARNEGLDFSLIKEKYRAKFNLSATPNSSKEGVK